ncbi:MAG: nucleotidyltransferase domain-containing protein [Cyclobacteriaceae bacterium]
MEVAIKDIPRLIKSKVLEIDPEAEVILFGSRARGDFRSDSDWDLLVLTNGENDFQTKNRIREGLYNIELESGESFSVLTYSKSVWEQKQKVTPLYEEVKAEGKHL